MKLAMAVVTGILEINAWAGQTLQNGPSVIVCIEDSGRTMVRYQATALASKMYAAIGVALDWRTSSRSCKGAGGIHIQLADRTPAKKMPGALAYALPYEGIHICVFYDRVEETVAADAVPFLLAHVLVHEIGHILQGIDRHSGTGVMKAHWGPADYRAMSGGHLPFTEEDAVLIHRGLEGRADRLLLAAVAR
jgi:hypothetical protein